MIQREKVGGAGAIVASSRFATAVESDGNDSGFSKLSNMAETMAAAADPKLLSSVSLGTAYTSSSPVSKSLAESVMCSPRGVLV